MFSTSVSVMVLRRTGMKSWRGSMNLRPWPTSPPLSVTYAGTTAASPSRPSTDRTTSNLATTEDLPGVPDAIPLSTGRFSKGMYCHLGERGRFCLKLAFAWPSALRNLCPAHASARRRLVSRGSKPRQRARASDWGTCKRNSPPAPPHGSNSFTK